MSLDDWHSRAVNTVNPYILEKNDKELVVYRGNCLNKTQEVVEKGDDWKHVMAITNGNWTPISKYVAIDIALLFPGVEVDRWNPWPVLLELNTNKRMSLKLDDDGIILHIKRTADDKTMSEPDSNAPAVYAKWCQLGFDVLCFATVVCPAHVNLSDPWLGLMQWKAEHDVELIYCCSSVIVTTCIDATEFIGHTPPELISLFNKEVTPPPSWLDREVVAFCSLMKKDRWADMLAWKKAESVVMEYKDATIIVAFAGVKTAPKRFPKGLKASGLCAMFNLGDIIPPGCITAWEPYYSVAEALPILSKAYGTAEFDKLVARVACGKLIRSP